MPSISVLVNTYNRAGPLRNCLEGYLHQTTDDFEVVVADDGSSDGTADVVRDFADRARCRVEHVWHEDRGHRRTVILNEGILACRAPLILFTDCDAVPARDLVQVHREKWAPRRLLCGGFVPLSEAETRGLTPKDVAAGEHERYLTPERRRAMRVKHWKSCYQIAIGRRRRPHNLAMNSSVAKADLLEVNGYDEEYLGVGSADGDLRERLRRVGVRPKSVLHSAVVFHQYHGPDPTRSQPSLQRNRERALRDDLPAFCEHGISSHPTAGA